MTDTTVSTTLLHILHWLLTGVANAMALFVIGRFIAWGYREHSYLYQFDDRTRLFDAWIRLVAPYIKRFHLAKYRARLEQLLGRSGVRPDWGSNEFIASQLILGAAVLVVGVVLVNVLLGLSFSWTLIATFMAVFLPLLKLQDLATVRFRSCNSDLPFALDYMALTVGAGLDFNQALSTVVADAPKSPLMDEFALVLRNMRLGMPRAEALREMDRRLSSPSIRLFVQTAIQGLELGTDMGRAVSAISKNIQTKRFQAAEEAAGKISVRMMIPMMMFVMPAVMIVLLGPMMLAYLANNG